MQKRIETWKADDMAWKYIRKLEEQIANTRKWLVFVSEELDNPYHLKHVRIGAKSLIQEIDRLTKEAK